MKERRKRAHVVGEVEEKGGQLKAKEEEKRKTHVLQKGDGRLRQRATEAASD